MCARKNLAVSAAAKTQDMASTAVARSACAPCKRNECKSGAVIQLRQQSALTPDRHFRWWLALRASVLRRAISSSTRPALHCCTSSVTVGRAALPQSGLRSPTFAVSRSEQMQTQTQNSRQMQIQVCASRHSFATSRRCGLTIRSTGPIAACRHLG